MGVPLVRDKQGTGGDPYTTTVRDFAGEYRVDESVVRGWIRRGQIPYIMVGPRKMRRIDGNRATPVVPDKLGPAVLRNRDQLVSHLIMYSGMTESIAREVVAGMNDEEVEATMREALEANVGEQS